MGNRVIASIAIWYVHFGVSRGLPFEELLAASGLRVDDMSDPDGLIPDDALSALWIFLVERLPNVIVPLELVKTFDINHLGIAGRMCTLSVCPSR